MSDETRDPIAAIVREAMDYAADHGRIRTAEDYADRIREAVATPKSSGEGGARDYLARLLTHYAPGTEPLPDLIGVVTQVDNLLTGMATPAAGEDVRDEIARILCEVAQEAHDDAPHVGPGPMYVPSDFGGHADRILALLRTPSGEGEAQKVEAVLRRWNRLAGDVEGSDGPLTETEIAAISRDVAAALRSEAQGEERAEDIARRIARDCRALYDRTPDEDIEMREALAGMVEGIEVRLASMPRAARRGEGGGE